jgi:hypothetical protein
MMTEHSEHADITSKPQPRQIQVQENAADNGREPETTRIKVQGLPQQTDRPSKCRNREKKHNKNREDSAQINNTTAQDKLASL